MGRQIYRASYPNENPPAPRHAAPYPIQDNQPPESLEMPGYPAPDPVQFEDFLPDEEESAFRPIAPAQEDFSHYESLYPLPDEPLKQPAPPPRHPPVRKKKRKKSPPVWYAAALLALLGLLALLFFIFSAYRSYAPFRQRVSAYAGDTILSGVRIDGIDVGGMTKAEAAVLLNQSLSEDIIPLSIQVTIDSTTYLLTQNDVPFRRNISDVLDEACSIGRTNSAMTLNTSVTPFEWRAQIADYTAQNGAWLYTSVCYDADDVANFVENVRLLAEKEPVNAQPASFNPQTDTFTFTDEVYGTKLDTDALLSALLNQLDSGNYSAHLTCSTTPVMPDITRLELQNSFGLITSFSIDTLPGEANQLIQQYCSALSGLTLPDGQTFSFLAACETLSGLSHSPEASSALSQTATVLFNAAMLSDLTLVSRSGQEEYPGYVTPGREAYARYPDVDLQFKNDTGGPVYIVCSFSQGKTLSDSGKITARVYGINHRASESIRLETENVSDTVIRTYRVYYRSGSAIKRETLCESVYSAQIQ